MKFQNWKKKISDKFQNFLNVLWRIFSKFDKLNSVFINETRFIEILEKKKHLNTSDKFQNFLTQLYVFVKNLYENFEMLFCFFLMEFETFLDSNHGQKSTELLRNALFGKNIFWYILSM